LFLQSRKRSNIWAPSWFTINSNTDAIFSTSYFFFWLIWFSNWSKFWRYSSNYFVKESSYCKHSDFKTLIKFLYRSNSADILLNYSHNLYLWVSTKTFSDLIISFSYWTLVRSQESLLFVISKSLNSFFNLSFSCLVTSRS
jgi:hypothetical protein